MHSIDQSILNALHINMGYQGGESVVIVSQEWDPSFDAKYAPAFDRSRLLCRRMWEAYRQAGIPVEWIPYVPLELRNGADAVPELRKRMGDPQVVFLPTVFSLTHTAFRRGLTEQGIRVASMPGFTLDLFEEDGPMSVDYRELDRITREVAARLGSGRCLRVTAPGTDMLVEVDTANIHVSSGLLTRPGAWGNLPGAEAYAPPVHEGKSRGHFTVPAGWGGTAPTPYPLQFHVEQGRFTDVLGETPEARDYIEKNIRPLLFGRQDFDILAEIGIGTNRSLNAGYVSRKGWSTLVAEKIGGSVHFANGNSRAMGGQNDVPIHIDWVVDQACIDYDYRLP